MSSRYIPAIVIISFFLLPLCGSSNPNNIAAELSDGNYATFLNLLNQTKLTDEINGRETVTVLAVDNGASGALSGKPLNVVKNILSVHIVLDLVDDDKIKQIRTNNKSYPVTTLLQSTGVAREGQGTLNFVPLPNNEVAIASTVKDSQQDVKYIEKLNKKNTHISVLHVSSVIQVPGIEAINATTTTPSAPTPKSAHAPQSPTKSPSAPGADVTSDGPSANSDKPSSDSPTKGSSPSEAMSSAPGFVSSILCNAIIVGLVGVAIIF